jgi:hypothetical protein
VTANPIDIAIGAGAVSKLDLKAFEKQRHRLDVADAAEARNTDLSGQFGGIYVRALQANFDIDAADTTTPDDGTTCIVSSGVRFKRAVALGTASLEDVGTGPGDIPQLDGDGRLPAVSGELLTNIPINGVLHRYLYDTVI